MTLPEIKAAFRGLFPSHIEGQKIRGVWLHVTNDYESLTILIGDENFSGSTVEEVVTAAEAHFKSQIPESVRLRARAETLIKLAEELETQSK